MSTAALAGAGAAAGAAGAGASMLIPGAGLALTALTTGYSIYQGNKEAKKAKDNAKQAQELARYGAEVQVSQILDAQTEAEKKAVQSMSVMARQAAIERGRIIASAGEAGVAGGSVSQQLLTSYQHEAEARGNEIYNFQAYKRQAGRQIEAVRSGLALNLPKYESSGPNTTSILLGGLSALASQAYDIYKRP